MGWKHLREILLNRQQEGRRSHGWQPFFFDLLTIYRRYVVA